MAYLWQMNTSDAQACVCAYTQTGHLCMYWLMCGRLSMYKKEETLTVADLSLSEEKLSRGVRTGSECFPQARAWS